MFQWQQNEGRMAKVGAAEHEGGPVAKGGDSRRPNTLSKGGSEVGGEGEVR